MERIWLSQYSDGVPKDIAQFPFTDLVSLIEDKFARYRDKPCIECAGRVFTFGEIDTLSRQFAAYLQREMGLGKGDNIALMTPNLPAFPVAMMGALRAGCTVVNVNPLYTPRELEHQLRDSQAKAMIVFTAVAPTFAAVAGGLDLDKVLLIGPQDLFLPAAARPETPAGLGEVTWFHQAVQDGAGMDFAPIAVTGDDLAFLQYTGGTTGLSKGAMLTHGNVTANVHQCEEWLAPKIIEGEELIVTALPLYHIFALVVNLFIYFNAGGCNLLIPNPRDMAAFLGALQGRAFTAMTGVNTLYNGLQHVPAFREMDFSQLRMCLGGGAAIQAAVAEGWKALTGCMIHEGYGLSETSPVLTINPLTNDTFTATIGVPVPATDLSLRDDDGNEVAMGEPGEICARGPQVMKGYWNRPDETAAVMTPDGYFKTGDIAVVDDRGYFTIVDRKKDMILVSGFNVYPNEIEAVLAGHSDVVEAACVGVPDDDTGEAVKVFVVKKPDSALEADEVRAWCRERLTPYKTPKQVVFLDELPKSTVGKILRRELRDA
ncbi:MAG: AMP-binding protein [Hyphomicrobiales bacterium]|nr:AMP-binding protein [Hyphomicrobiales bacterium]MCP5371025.1 AMP-binding protein [Hyphomicrobiales bacterium]